MRLIGQLLFGCRQGTAERVKWGGSFPSCLACQLQIYPNFLHQHIIHFHHFHFTLIEPPLNISNQQTIQNASSIKIWRWKPSTIPPNCGSAKTCSSTTTSCDYSGIPTGKGCSSSSSSSTTPSTRFCRPRIVRSDG
jgi:hypothetical protein